MTSYIVRHFYEEWRAGNLRAASSTSMAASSCKAPIDLPTHDGWLQGEVWFLNAASDAQGT